MRPAHTHQQVFPLEKCIPLELYPDVVPEVCAVDPVGGECLFRTRFQGHERLVEQRGAKLGQTVVFAPAPRAHGGAARRPAPCPSLGLDNACRIGFFLRHLWLHRGHQVEGFDP